MRISDWSSDVCSSDLNLMMRIVDVLYSLPFMFFVIMLMVVFGRNIFLIFVALGAVEWLTMARIVRGQTIAVKRKEFIEAAQAGCISNTKILFRSAERRLWKKFLST